MFKDFILMSLPWVNMTLLLLLLLLLLLPLLPLLPLLFPLLLLFIIIIIFIVVIVVVFIRFYLISRLFKKTTLSAVFNPLQDEGLSMMFPNASVQRLLVPICLSPELLQLVSPSFSLTSPVSFSLRWCPVSDC